MPRGFLEKMRRELIGLKPIPVTVNPDKSVTRGFVFTQNHAESENLLTLKRTIALPSLLEMIMRGEVRTNVEGFGSKDEHAVGAWLSKDSLSTAGV